MTMTAQKREPMFIGFTENYFLDMADKIISHNFQEPEKLAKHLKAFFINGREEGKRIRSMELRKLLEIGT